MRSIGPRLRSIESKIQKQLMAGLHEAAQLGRNEVIKEIQATKPHPPIDTSIMAAAHSWPVTALFRGGKQYGWLLTSNVLYADIQELGTKPFWAPLPPLVAWASRKLRGAEPLKKRKGKPGRKNTKKKTRNKTKPKPRKAKTAEDHATQMAKAVRFKISKVGIRPKGFYARASVRFPGHVSVAIAKHLREVR